MAETYDRPLILVTNDDGVQAPGLQWLTTRACGMGDVIVVAPDTVQSGKSSAITLDAPLRVTRRAAIGTAKVYSVSGTPVDCVKMALHTIVPRRPDLLVSGINHGSNSGTAVIYSGTMGAVLEGCMVGIPSVGFSLLHHSIDADFSLSINYVEEIMRRVLATSLPAGVCLNVNIPAKVTPKGVRACRAASGHWEGEYEEYADPTGRPFYWLTGHFVNTEPDATDTDEYWLSRQYISLVPVSPEMSATPAVAGLAKIYDK